jgi:endonuclease/exonuclease/phosphatase family metal-dependent hydrolase
MIDQAPLPTHDVLGLCVHSAIDVWKKEKEAEVGQEDLPIVLCGDFNSTPDSAIYALLTSGQVRAAAAASGRSAGPRGNRGGGPAKSPAAAVAGRSSASRQQQQRAPWRSAYALHQQTVPDAEAKEDAAPASSSTSGEPRYTTLLPHSAQVVDYILWPAASSMRVSALVPIPQVAEGSGLPSAIYSSDHFSLMCEFV